jgi:hypothetical protein
MAELGSRGQLWLKIVHVLSSCIWVGCGIALTVSQFVPQPAPGPELAGRLAVLDFIDIWVLVPGALGCLGTSVVYSVWTRWGWFRHRWITVKWVICVFGVLFGTFALGPWLSSLAELARTMPPGTTADGMFSQNRGLLQVFGTLQVSTLIFATAISVLKPWRRNQRPQLADPQP